VSAPDFEISTRLHAQRLTAHLPPEAETVAEEVVIDRRESSNGLPAKLERGGRYRGVDVEKKLVGEQLAARGRRRGSGPVARPTPRAAG
jgi:hypothetical protein